LRTISASLNNNLIPVRMPYPEEEALNREITMLPLVQQIITVSISQFGGINNS
jgi:hypothetical protein